MQRIEKCRMNQANSRQRRAVRAIRENCNRPTSTTVESSPVVEANTGDTAMGSLYELAEDWPDFVDLSRVDVQPSVPRPVNLLVKDVEVQVRPEAESKDVQYTPSVQHASCQSLSTPVVGPELPPGGLSISDIICASASGSDPWTSYSTPGRPMSMAVVSHGVKSASAVSCDGHLGGENIRNITNQHDQSSGAFRYGAEEKFHGSLFPRGRSR
jgi:hypothetical protein